MEEEIREGTWRWLARRTCPQELRRTKMLKIEKKGLCGVRQALLLKTELVR